MAGAEKYREQFNEPGRMTAAVAAEGDTARARQFLRTVPDQMNDLSRDQIRRLVPSLKQAQVELERGLAKWLGTVKDGGDRYTAHRKRALLRQVREALALAGRLGVPLGGALVQGNAQAATFSNRLLTREVTRLSSIFGGDMGTPVLDLNTAAQLMERNKTLIGRMRASAARYGLDTQRWIRKRLSIGVLKGDSIHQMAERLMKSAKVVRSWRGLDGGVEDVARTMAQGIYRSPLANAERIVRTELMNAYNQHHQSQIESWAESTPGALKRWDASSDYHCELCAALDGEIVGVNEEFHTGHMHPPRHPNCRCVLVPWMSHWPELEPLKGGPRAPIVTKSGTAADARRVAEKQARKPKKPSKAGLPGLDAIPKDRMAVKQLRGRDLPGIHRFRSIGDEPVSLAVTDEQRVENIREVFRKGQAAVDGMPHRFRTISLTARADGTWEVNDGRHRLMALQDFPDIRMQFEVDKPYEP